MSPPRCARCAAAAALRHPRTGQPLCRPCFVGAFEDEILRAVAAGRPTLSPGTTVAVAASGGKDSSVLSHVLARLSGRLGLRLLLLSVDEGISGYRDASLAAVRRHRGHLPLLLVSHEGLYGWPMDRVAAGLPRGGHCTVCGVLRRRALERAARALGIHALATGHNADDIAETVLMNFLRGDVARLRRTATEATGATSEATGATGEATEATGEATEAMATTRIPETATRMDTEATRATAEMTTVASEATRSTTKATRSPTERTNSTDATISSAEATKDFMETTRSSVETTRDPIGTTRSPVELPEVMEATKNLPEATKTSVNATKSSMKPPRNRQKATGSSMEAAGSHTEGSRSSTEGSRRPQGLARPVASAEAAPLPAVPRCKPLRHAYEKEIVLYAHFEGLDYVSTECVYAPQAYRGHARTLLKELEATRASAVAALGHSGRFLAVREQVATKALRACSQCGFAASQPLCKACVLLASLERGLPRLALGKRVPGVAIRDGGQWVTELGDGELGGGGRGVGDHGVSGHGGCCRGGGHGASGLEVNGHQVGGHGHGHGDGGRGVGGHGASCHGSADHGVGDQGPGGHGACCSGPAGHGEGGRGPGGPVPCCHGPGVPGPRGQGAGDEVEVEVVVGRGGRGQRRRVRGLGRVRGALNIWDF